MCLDTRESVEALLHEGSAYAYIYIYMYIDMWDHETVVLITKVLLIISKASVIRTTTSRMVTSIKKTVITISTAISQACQRKQNH